MPEFELNTNHKRNLDSKTGYHSLSFFARGYVEAMFFTNGDMGDEREDLLNELGTERLTRAAIKDIKADCDKFLSRIMPDGCFAQQWLDRANEATSYEEEQAGRDFWFTRQGHGVGFWARDNDELPEDIGAGLNDVAKSFSEASVEVSRGWIYHL